MSRWNIENFERQARTDSRQVESQVRGTASQYDAFDLGRESLYNLPFGASIVHNLANQLLNRHWREFKHLVIPDMRKDREILTNSPITPRRLVYGHCRVGGQLVYAESTGDGNKYLHIVVAVAGHAIHGFGKIWLDDKLSTAYGSKVYIETFDGTQTAACASLVAASGGYWTADHILKGIAYVYLRFEYDETLYVGGMPTPMFEVYGKKVYDPRTGLTAYSANPALCIRDYMLMSEEDGGMGCSAGEIDDTYIIAAANVCDQQVLAWESETIPQWVTDAYTLNGWGTPSAYENRYEINGTLPLEGTPKQIVDAMLQSMLGECVYIQGKWRIFAAGWSTPYATTVDESWLAGDISFALGSDKANRINTVTGSYVDRFDSWAIKGFPEVTDTDYVTDDGEQLRNDVALNFCISETMARRIATLAMERSRVGATLSMPCNLKAFDIEPHAIISVDNTLLGWTGRTFRVIGWSFGIGGGVNLELREETEDLYTKADGGLIDATEPPTTNLPDPWIVVAPGSITATERLASVNYQATTLIDLDLSWASNDTTADRYELQWMGPDDVSYRVEPIIMHATSYILRGVKEGAHVIRVRATNTIGYSSWVTLNYTVVGIAASAVPNVTGLTLFGQDNETEFTGRDIRIAWNKVAPWGQSEAEGPASPVRFQDWFRYYELKVYGSDGNLRRTEYLTEEFYTYTHENNHLDGLGTPDRGITFRLKVVTTWGTSSATNAVLTITNSAPAALTGITLTGGANTLQINLPASTDLDFAGYLVFASQTNGFTPGPSNQVNEGGPETVCTLVNLTAGTWYVKAAAYDAFGADGINYSAQVSAVVTSVEVTAEMLDPLQRVDFFVRESVFYFEGAELHWDAGYIDRADTTYPFDAGSILNANASYIGMTYSSEDGSWTPWALPIASGIPTLTSNQILIGITSSTANDTGNYICYIRQANSIAIEGALIRDATIGDAKISDLSADKITAGEIDASVIDVVNLSASNITSGSIDASTITITNIDASNISTGTLTAGYISVGTGDSYSSGSLVCYGSFGTLPSNTVDIQLDWARASLIKQNDVGLSITGTFSGTGTSGYLYGYAMKIKVIPNSASCLGYGAIFEVDDSTYVMGAPVRIVPAQSASAPTHSALCGSLWVTSAGVLYINTSSPSPGTTWTKVGAQ